MHDHDGIEEAFETQLRLAVTSAARVGEAIARMRQHAKVRAAAESEARAGALASRLEAQRAVARASYSGAYDSSWWDSANAEQIAAVYQTAVAWRSVDPEAARVEALMVDEVKRRYDVDVRGLGTVDLGPELAAAADRLGRQGDLDGVEAAVLLAAADRADQAAVGAAGAEVEAPTPVEAREAGLEVTAADHDRQEALDGAEVAWDSAERRAATAAALTGAVDNPQAVEAKMIADTAQAEPPAAATRQPSGRRSRAVTRPGSGAARQRQQRGISR